jgi:hypothetical protein
MAVTAVTTETAVDPRAVRPPSVLDVIPKPDPVFYAPELLTKRPEAISAVDFKSVAFGETISAGKVVLKLWIDENGAVFDIRAGENKLPAAALKPIIAIFMASKFAPGEREGKRVGAVMFIEVNVDSSPSNLVDRAPM